MANMARLASAGSALAGGPLSAATLSGALPPSAPFGASPVLSPLAQPGLKDEHGVESYAELKERADRLEQRVSMVTTTGRRRMASAARDPNGIPPVSLLSKALNGGGASELASAAAQNAPLQLQLMLPLLLLGILFGIVSVLSFAAGGRGGAAGEGGVPGRKGGHRRTASGEQVSLDDDESSRRGSFVDGAYTSPRRGFAFSGSWAHNLVEEGGAPGAAPQRGGAPQGAAQSAFALPPSFVSHAPERRSPGGRPREEGRPLDV